MPVPPKTQKHPAMPGVFDSGIMWLIAGTGSFHPRRFCGLATCADGMASTIVVIAHAISAILTGAVACTLVLRKRRLFNYRHIEDFHNTYYRR
jgi:hypothetical protein